MIIIGGRASPIAAGSVRDSSEARASDVDGGGLAGGDLGNLTIQRALRDPPRCERCAATSQRFGVQAKCAECQTRAQAKCTDCAAETLDGARPALDSAAEPLPHFDRIQAAFGRHDLSEVRTVVGGEARTANDDIGARAFTAGPRIGFRESPDVWLAAHESAHVVQQRDGATAPSGGAAGGRGDAWEHHADQVADAVVAGRSAEPLLDAVTGTGRVGVGGAAPALQRDGDPDKDAKTAAPAKPDAANDARKPHPDENQDGFEQRVKDVAIARLNQNIATLGQWSSYVASMTVFQLQTQLLTSEVSDWATTARGMAGGDQKFETLVGTKDWGERSYLEQQLRADATYRSKVAGQEDMLRTKSYGYRETPSVVTKLQVQTGELQDENVPPGNWVEADPRYHNYRETFDRIDRGEIHSGCQYCHELNLDRNQTIDEFGTALPKGEFGKPGLANMPPEDLAKIFDMMGPPKAAPAETPDEPQQAPTDPAPQPQPQPTAQPAAPANTNAPGDAPAANPFLPDIDVPAAVTVPPPRSSLCGSLPDAPAGAPSPNLASWGPNSEIVARIIGRTNAALTPLGPRGYRVLTSDTFDALWSMSPDNLEAVRGTILAQIDERVAKYVDLRGEIPGSPYYELCPIVDELLPTTSESVKLQAVEDVLTMRFFEAALTGLEILLVGLTFMFPPLAIATVPAGLALGLVRMGMGLDQVRQGDQWSAGVGAGIYSPDQEAQAPGLHTRGLINVATGAFAMVSGFAGYAARSAAAAEAGGDSLVNVIETSAGMMITHKLYPGCVLWVEGNAIEVMNEAGEVIATGLITPSGIVWQTGPLASTADAASASTAIVPSGPTAMVPYGQSAAASPFTLAPAPLAPAPLAQPPFLPGFATPLALPSFAQPDPLLLGVGPTTAIEPRLPPSIELPVQPPMLPGYAREPLLFGPAPQPRGLLPPSAAAPKAWDAPDVTLEEFIKSYRARFPATPMSDEMLAARFAAGKRLNPSTGALATPRVQAPEGFLRSEPLPESGTPAYEQWQKWQPGDPNAIPCFPAGTPVHTPTGLVPIDALRPGDAVLAGDADGRAVASIVTDVHANWAAELVDVDTPRGAVHATLNHPFRAVGERAWLPAGLLAPGATLQLADGSTTHVRSVERVAAREATFNLSIADHHTYFVGAAGVLVHNAPPSSYASGVAYDTQIYRVIDRRTGQVVYVGQTDQTLAERLYQHATKEESVLYLADAAERANYKSIYDIKFVERGRWTVYEANVWEQHVMDVQRANGATLLNRQEGVDWAKGKKYVQLHNPCRT